MPAIRKGDTVKVIAGKEKGKSGKVLEVLREAGRVRVEKGRSQASPDGGIVEKAGTIAISNVMVVGQGDAPVRLEKAPRELGAKEKARLAKRQAAR
jgi:large subunit ribosomal protein L24